MISGHTEDGWRICIDLCYVVKAENVLNGKRWTSFCYPGDLAGYCMSVTGDGVSISINATGVPDHVFNQFGTRKLQFRTL